ncbi:MAG: hypothetical protein HN909_09275 [Phycisphaerales bacterium]|jgi:hypothetical protein|nr:hypothetical protein [Phycisphaerales bacterium]
MASFKLNLAMYDGPDAATIAAAMEQYGRPEDSEYGVLNFSAAEEVVFATIIRRVHQAVPQLDEESEELTSRPIEKVTLLPVGIYPAKQRLEVYEGGPAAIDYVTNFLANELALAVVVNQIELDVATAVEKLEKNTQRFQLKSIRVSEYAHNSYMMGPYAPKFLDTASGMEFLNEYVDFCTSAQVRFQGPRGRISVTVSPKSCFRYSLSEEDDKPHVQSLLRQLL